MARKAKAKATKPRGNKSKGKKGTAGKAKAGARTTASPKPHPLNSLLMTAVSTHVFQSLSDQKIGAVNACVNAEMNKVTDSWNDAGHMDKDYHQDQKSMAAFLSDVRVCLLAKQYNFNMNDPALIDACVSAAVYQLKLLVYGRTK
jgi:hypothetical protein